MNTSVLDNHIEEKIAKPRGYVSLNSASSLQTVLDRLGKVEGKVYYVKDKKDFIIPRSNTRVHNFEELNQYVRDTSGFELLIVKNRFRKEMPKIIEVRDVRRDNKELDGVEIALEDEHGTVKDVIDYINRYTEYSIIVDNGSFIKGLDNGTAGTQGQANQAANVGVPGQATNTDDEDGLREILTYSFYLKGHSLSDLLNFFRESLNLFTEVDYERKTITLSKYKLMHYQVSVPNITLEEDDTTTSIDGSGSSSSQTQAQTVNTGTNDPFGQTTSNPKVYEELRDNIYAILNSYQENFEPSLNKTTGTLYVKGSYKVHSKISKLVNEYNDGFSKRINVTITFYDIILKRDHQFGIDFSLSNQRGVNYKNRYVDNQFLFRTVKEDEWAWFVESAHEFGEVYNKNEYEVALQNHIPYIDDRLIESKYIASKKSNTTTDSGGNTIISEDLVDDTYTEGYVFKYFPMIDANDRISLKVSISKRVLQELKEREYGTNKDTITMPTIEKINTSPFLTFEDGDRIIVWQNKFMDSADSYDGVMPVNDFVIGGKSGKAFVMRQQMIVVAVNLAK